MVFDLKVVYMLAIYPVSTNMTMKWQLFHHGAVYMNTCKNVTVVERVS